MCGVGHDMLPPLGPPRHATTLVRAVKAHAHTAERSRIHTQLVAPLRCQFQPCPTHGLRMLVHQL